MPRSRNGTISSHKEKRHEEVPEEHSQDTVLFVSPVRDEKPLVDDAESVVFGASIIRLPKVGVWFCLVCGPTSVRYDHRPVEEAGLIRSTEITRRRLSLALMKSLPRTVTASRRHRNDPKQRKGKVCCLGIRTTSILQGNLSRELWKP
jgi:hypothetical protein